MNRSLFVAQFATAKKGEYYWPGDGFVNRGENNELVIFAYRLRNTADAVHF